jgi:hypothetical protein
MGFFGREHGVHINERVAVDEGNYVHWHFHLDHDHAIQLVAQRVDGAPLHIYTMSEAEFRNFQQDLNFRVFSDLSLEYFESFDRTRTLSAGDYALVVHHAPTADGLDRTGIAAIRCDSLR